MQPPDINNAGIVHYIVLLNDMGEIHYEKKTSWNDSLALPY